MQGIIYSTAMEISMLSPAETSHFSRIEDDKTTKNSANKNSRKANLVSLNGEAQEFPRIKTGINELDRVLGGGLVQGSVVLIGGDPGIGKSTLLLQTADSLAKSKNSIIYISGEESVDQVRLRAKRLECDEQSIKLASTTNVAEIINTIKDEKSPVIVIMFLQPWSIKCRVASKPPLTLSTSTKGNFLEPPRSPPKTTAIFGSRSFSKVFIERCQLKIAKPST